MTFTAGNGPIVVRARRVAAAAIVCLALVFAPVVATAQQLITLHGTVVDSAGAPVAGAVVTAGSATTTTGADGRFSLEVATGRVALEVLHPRYATLHHEMNVSGSSRELELRLVSLGVVSESITVTGVRAGDAAPITKTNIDSKKLDEMSFGQDTPTLIQYTPSVTWYSESGGADGGSNYSYFSLRGIQQTRINMTFDGAPLNDPAEDALYFNNFYDFTSAVDSVQIQRGVGTSSVGAPSYGGSINFASVPFTLEPKTSVQLGGGSWGAQRGSVAWQSGTLSNGLSLYGRASFADTDGYRDHSGSKHHTLFFNAGWQGEKSQWKLVSFSGDERSQMSYYAVDPATLAENRRFNPLQPEEKDHFGQDFAQLQYTREIGDQSLLVASVYYNGAKGHFDLWNDPVAKDELLKFGIDQYFVGSLVTLTKTTGRLDTTVGVQYDDFQGDHSLDAAAGRLYLNTGYKNRASAFVKSGLTLGRWLLYGDAQLRWAKFRYEGSLDLGSIDWTFFDPKIGARYTISPSATIYASVGRAQREPTRLDLLAGEDDATVVHDFRAVKPEKLTDVETGIDFTTNRLALHANLYAMEFRDEIALTGELSDIGLPLRRNVDRSYRRGLEVDAKWNVAPHWSLTTSANLSHNRIREWTQYFDVYDAEGNWLGTEPRVYRDVAPLLTPEVIVNQGVEWSRSGTSVGAIGRWVASSYLDNTGTNDLRTPKYVTVDLHAAIPLDRFWSVGSPKLSVWVNNLTNEKDAYPSGYSYQYIDRSASGQDALQGIPYYYPLAERNVMATLEFEF